MTSCLTCGAGRGVECRCVANGRDDRYDLIAAIDTRDGQLRVQLVRHAGWDSLDLREWSRSSDGDLHATRRGVRMTLAQGHRIASAIDQAIVEQSHGEDAILLVPTRIGLGFMLTMPEMQLGPNERVFGHPGMGGSLGFADPDAKVGFGYVMNKMLLPPDLIDPRWPPLIDALYESL